MESCESWRHHHHKQYITCYQSSQLRKMILKIENRSDTPSSSGTSKNLQSWHGNICNLIGRWNRRKYDSKLDISVTLKISKFEWEKNGLKRLFNIFWGFQQIRSVKKLLVRQIFGKTSCTKLIKGRSWLSYVWFQTSWLQTRYLVG